MREVRPPGQRSTRPSLRPYWHSPPGRPAQGDVAGDEACDGPFRMVPQLAARRARPRGRGRRRGRFRRAARVLGRARHAVGAAHERGVDRRDGVAGAGGDRRRVRDRRAAAARDRDRADRAVGRAAARGAGRGLRAGNHAVPCGPGRVHRDDRGAVQPARPRGLAGRTAADRGRGHRLCGQPGGRGAVLAARRGVGGRRRPRRHVQARRGVPEPGGGLGAERADAPAGRGGRRRERRASGSTTRYAASSPSRAARSSPRKTCGRW